MDDAGRLVGLNAPGSKHGFRHNQSKTDNFKIKPPVPNQPPTPVCGDNHVDSGEACDDGNMANDDGCSSTCTIQSTSASVDGASCATCASSKSLD
ncbi:MAG: hypothetical protein JWP01_1146 [Myxococcales bacterium]|nr:hypothetical protein [Myxococcales bacterium]